MKFANLFFTVLFLLCVQGNKYVEFEKAFTLALKNSIGQIGGIDVDLNDNLVVFHRADRIWSNE
jgi:hypothetical protein